MYLTIGIHLYDAIIIKSIDYIIRNNMENRILFYKNNHPRKKLIPLSSYRTRQVPTEGSPFLSAHRNDDD